jgi:transglutaminase-like putative cysteine protease
MAIGVVWSDELEAFAYHAWPEVWVGRWVWMDPTLGQPVADATHIKLASGGLESWPRVLAFLGRLRLEVVEVE